MKYDKIQQKTLEIIKIFHKKALTLLNKHFPLKKHQEMYLGLYFFFFFIFIYIFYLKKK